MLLTRRKEAISLYRQSLRVLRAIPIPAIRQKFQYNIRELFSIYQSEPEHKATEALADGQSVLKLLQEILNGRRNDTAVYSLFKSFENANLQASTPEADSKQQILPL